MSPADETPEIDLSAAADSFAAFAPVMGMSVPEMREEAIVAIKSGELKAFLERIYRRVDEYQAELPENANLVAQSLEELAKDDNLTAEKISKVFEERLAVMDLTAKRLKDPGSSN